MRTLSVGITGGIGSGKSEVARIFSSYGCKHISADDVAKDLMETDPLLKKRLQQAFGSNVYMAGGHVDRKRLASLIFNDETARKKLNGLVHPATLRYIRKEIDHLKKANQVPMVVVEAALLFEARAQTMFDYVIAVEADENVRMQRVMQRDGMNKHDVMLRMASQNATLENIDDADFTIVNSLDRKALEEKCAFIFSLLQKIA